MTTKRAAQLSPGDTVIIAAGDRRTVESWTFTDQPIDVHGTSGVCVSWQGRAKCSTLAADKFLNVIPATPATTPAEPVKRPGQRGWRR